MSDKVFTMLDIAKNIITKDTSASHQFDDIFAQVEEVLSNTWNEYAFNNQLTYEEVRKRKIGELWRILTVDKTFKRNEHGEWECSSAEVF
ncbi:hypothetical protein ACJA23_02675 [Mycoplasma corogypsi]|uniref:hypothetical protein n=1 Tax=Mycoplasma corogypsi TaxID=2106 RepID=UPI003873310F